VPPMCETFSFCVECFALRCLEFHFFREAVKCFAFEFLCPMGVGSVPQRPWGAHPRVPLISRWLRLT
jgi:hypothetical protein